jgi:hypothetical protein
MFVLAFICSTSLFAQYCPAASTNDTFEWIGNVTLNTINNTSGTTGTGYTDFTGLTTNLAQGSTHTISLTPAWSGTVYNEGFGVWIDFNQDNDFTDPGEQVVALGANAVSPRTANITIPGTALLGTTRMRVVMDDAITPSNPCTSPNFGEVEDYSVNIVAGSATCISTVNTFPYSEDFEAGEGLWEQAAGDDLNLTRDQAGTPSGGTGPSSGDGDNWYMYIEASGNGTGYPSRTANYDSPCFDLTAESSANFQYSYHMFGADVGTLNVNLSTNNGLTYPVNLRSFSGNLGNVWNQDVIDLSAYIGQTIKIRFSLTSGSTGSGWSSDIAIDNVNFTTTASPEINITGNTNTISDGDTTPDASDNTDFGIAYIGTTTEARTFTIENVGSSDLNLTDASPYVSIGGANAGDFSVTVIPIATIAGGSSTTFEITFNPLGVGARNATLSIANNDTDENPYNYSITGEGLVSAPEIEVEGNSTIIADGDSSPSFGDDTDFGATDIAGGTIIKTFRIDNLGSANLTLGTFTIGGAHAADFTVTNTPAAIVAAGANTTVEVTFDPSVIGLRTATLSITNNDGDENPFNFSIQGTGFDGLACGTYVLHTADFETGTNGWTSGGANASRVNNTTWSYGGDYSLRVRNQDPTGPTSSFDSQTFDFVQYDKIDIKLFFSPNSVEDTEGFSVEYSNDNGTNWTTVQVFEGGSVSGKTADFESTSTTIFYSKIITLQSSDYSFTNQSVIKLRSNASANDDEIYIDDLIISGTIYCAPTVAPGGVTANLDLWLKADMIDGSSEATDASAVNQWVDNGKGNNAEVMITGQEPVYRDNTTHNFNFNPVIEFENDNTTASADMTYIISDGSRDELTGTGGFNSNDMFVVIMPDPTITTTMVPLDTFTSTDPVTPDIQTEDVTGFGYGSYSVRFTGEYFSYCIGPSNTSGTQGYGKADTTGSNDYNQIGIINIRDNTGLGEVDMYLNGSSIGNSSNDLASFASVNNTRYWLGRSQYWNGSFDGRIAEVITYSATNSDANLTQARNRIQSYLAIKYGITLGVNGTSQDYVDSSGTVIWDQSANAGYNFDIAGIGRDDSSELNQKQSSSVNDATDGLGPIEGVLTVGLTDIYDTNTENKNLNGTNLNNRDYLVWGNNGANLELDPPSTITVNMSTGITPALTSEVTFTRISRIWKFVESGSDIPDVKISIPISAIRNVVAPGNYYMFISDTGSFDPTATYAIMSDDGAGNLETDYDFDGTKYITFGYAPQVEIERSVYFDGTNDYIDVEDRLDIDPNNFTISAWIKRDAADSGTKSIVSKRNTSFTTGFDLRIIDDNRIQVYWKNGTNQILPSITSIPDDEWHHIAVTYDGSTLYIYIDGVLDNFQAKTPPLTVDESFVIGAAGKGTLTQFFRGNIDEVRVWDATLTVDQLRFIMNQEIEDNAGQVMGKELPTTISKNDIDAVPWSDLSGYYPMSIYTYTNINDASGNGKQGALRNLNTVARQTAPLPYVSAQNGTWDTKATWTNGSEQYIPGSTSIVDPDVTVDWNIVRTSHDITVDNSSLPAVKEENRKILGLYVDANELTLDGDNTTETGNAITVTHYLSLTGKIDLEGESQLIQEEDSDLFVDALGQLEKDQQGTADTFTYNYWSAPVGDTDTGINNYRYTVQDIMLDGTDPITFDNTSYDGDPGTPGTTPISISDYWIWKFANLPTGDYSSWQHVRRTGTLNAGEGFTMKGPGSGTIIDNQNYVFLGKPNNGEIDLSITAGNDYLVGNPYASAIDADIFIADNGPTIDYSDPTDTDPDDGMDDGIIPETNALLSGTLYFWEHWGGGSHVLQEYQGGYATYNFSGAVAAASMGTNDPDVGTGGTPTKTPGRYIPVGQGFFVSADNNGTVNFNNGQRVFQKEGGAGSVFMRGNSQNSNRTTLEDENSDDRMKFRIGFNSINTIHRQLLLTIDENTTPNVDWAYDAKLNEVQMDDMFWTINGGEYVIQASNAAEESSAYPIGIKTESDGINTITIDELENVPNTINIYLHDIALNLYHDLRASNYEIFLNAGEYLDRFEITFSNTASTLGVDDETQTSLDVLYSNDIEKIILINPNLLEVKSIELYNILGQSVYTIENISESGYSEYEVKNLSTGTYIIKLYTVSGSVSTKKVLVK